MTRVTITRDRVELAFTRLEKLTALKGNLEIPLGDITGCRAVDCAYDEVHGLRMPGTAVPFVYLAGTFLPTGGPTTFAMVHGRGPGIVIDVTPSTRSDVGKVVVTCEDAQRVAAQITDAVAAHGQR